MAGFSNELRQDHETDLSTVYHPPQAHTRIQGAHENARRPRRIAFAPRKGARASRRLKRAASPNSFSKASRLVGQNAFAPVFAYKCSVAGKFFQVYARPNLSTGSRLGISVNKRYAPRAVARNSCKRLAREMFRISRNELTGADFIVRARGAVLAASRAEARTEVLDLLRRAWQLCSGGGAAAQNR